MRIRRLRCGQDNRLPTKVGKIVRELGWALRPRVRYGRVEIRNAQHPLHAILTAPRSTARGFPRRLQEGRHVDQSNASRVVGANELSRPVLRGTADGIRSLGSRGFPFVGVTVCLSTGDSTFPSASTSESISSLQLPRHSSRRWSTLLTSSYSTQRFRAGRSRPLVRAVACLRLELSTIADWMNEGLRHCSAQHTMVYLGPKATLHARPQQCPASAQGPPPLIRPRLKKESVRHLPLLRLGAGIGELVIW